MTAATSGDTADQLRRRHAQRRPRSPRAAPGRRRLRPQHRHRALEARRPAPTAATTRGTAAATRSRWSASAVTYDNPQLIIQTLDPKTGKPVSEYKMPPGIEYASVVSTEPLVVAADVGDTAGDGSGISDFFSIDDVTGKLRTKIAADGEKYAARCDGIHRGRELPAAGRRQRPALPADRGARGHRRLRQDQRDRLLRPRHRQADRRQGRRGRRLHDLPAAHGRRQHPRVQGVPRTTRAARSSPSTAPPSSRPVRWRTRATSPSGTRRPACSTDYAEILYADGRLYMSEVMVSKPTGALPRREGVPRGRVRHRLTRYGYAHAPRPCRSIIDRQGRSFLPLTGPFRRLTSVNRTRTHRISAFRGSSRR